MTALADTGPEFASFFIAFVIVGSLADNALTNADRYPY